MRRRVISVLGLLLATALQAESLPTPAWLPATSQAAAWIEGDASVAFARHGTAAASHAAQALSTGAHEWALRLQAQRRQLQDGSSPSREWQAHLERPVRVNGKAALDSQLGDVERELARALLGEARHESARALADLWIAELAARQRESLAASQVVLADSNLTAVQKRRRAGDASLLDEQQAQAEAGDTRRELILARSALTKAQAALRARFGAEVPAEAMLGDVGEPAWAEAAWHARVMQEADAIKARQAELRRSRLTAARARADRVADPVVGAFIASEARGSERLLGLSLTLPLGGTHREQRSLQLAREADMSESALEQMRREVDLQARETWADAQGARERWLLSRETSRLTNENARLAQRAYTLGESDLQTLLLARRQAGLASAAALDARAEALRWEARLLIDAHQVWDLEHD